MNKRQIKKFCKKGGHYHFDPTIRKISKKRMMYPYVTHGHYGYMITWHEVGTCLTCLHCTDVMIDWSGEPYACYSNTIRCSGCDNFSCKRYKLDNEIEFFKFAHIYSHSPESDAKRYIDKQIKEKYESSTDIPVETDSNSSSEDIENKVNERLKKWLDDYTVKEDLFNDKEILDYLDKQYAEQENWESRPDVDVSHGFIRYFEIVSTKRVDMFEVGKKYLLNLKGKTICVICIAVEEFKVGFVKAIPLDDEFIIGYEFAENEFRISRVGDLIVKENKDGKIEST